MAQLVARERGTFEVEGSNPSGSTDKNRASNDALFLLKARRLKFLEM